MNGYGSTIAISLAKKGPLTPELGFSFGRTYFVVRHPFLQARLYGADMTAGKPVVASLARPNSVRRDSLCGFGVDVVEQAAKRCGIVVLVTKGSSTINRGARPERLSCFARQPVSAGSLMCMADKVPTQISPLQNL
jgi:hypothetical protein